MVVKPTLIPAAFSAGILAAALLLFSVGLVYLVPLPATEQYGTIMLLGFIFLGLISIAIWNDVVVYCTQSYAVDTSTVKINVGFALKQSKSIDRSNIASVVGVMPFPARIFGIGSVEVNTTDGYSATMVNIKNPLEVVKRIESKASSASPETKAPITEMTSESPGF
ncbi:MAG: PH domain-containing protein [Nitrososphaerota archaeon]|nr:PH domain-containing protein [Nitrososphaerota archaeon]